MKLNWGWALFVAMTIFIVFIVGLSIKLMRQDASVEHEDYYLRGLQHDRQMAMERRAAPYADSISVSYSGQQVRIRFPRSLQLPIHDLRVQMYRASSSELDQYVRYTVPVNRYNVTVPVKELVPGKWEARLSWLNENDSAHYVERNLFIE